MWGSGRTIGGMPSTQPPQDSAQLEHHDFSTSGSDFDGRVETPESTAPLARPGVYGFWLLLTALVGAVATGLLLYERVQLWNDPEHSTACDISPWVSCGQVMESWQASTFGFPNIFIGVVAFPVLIAVAVTVLTGLRLPRWYHLGLQLGVTFAFGFCVWLWFNAVYVIEVLCPYCMVVWAAVIPLFFVTTARNILTGVIPAPAGLRKAVSGWWWVAVILVYLLVFASIMMHFSYVFTS